MVNGSLVETAHLCTEDFDPSHLYWLPLPNDSSLYNLEEQNHIDTE